MESDGEDVERFLGGDPEPAVERKQPWLDQLAIEVAAGKLRHRVHVLTTPLSPYLRYECEWGYLPNARAGEQIRILDLSEASKPEGLVDEDFWILDDSYVIRMHYDSGGVFVGGGLADDVARYRKARDAAIAASEDFLSWWEHHPDEWRVNWAATNA